jgi:hypothetical protein
VNHFLPHYGEGKKVTRRGTRPLSSAPALPNYQFETFNLEDSMTSAKWIFVAIASWGSAVAACPSAEVKFQGTAFAQHAFRVQDNQIVFFAGSPRQVAWSFDSQARKWCYENSHKTGGLPAKGCMESRLQSGKRVHLVNGESRAFMALRDPQGKAVATLRVVGQTLTANFLNASGKVSGKWVMFKSKSGVLDIRGWNCPNPKFLSCAGGNLLSVPEYGETRAPAGEKNPISVVELSKPSHYHSSCEALVEYTPPRSQK